MATVTFNVLITEEEDGSLWAEVKELPGCFASGFSVAELQEATVEAIQMCLPSGVRLGSPRWSPAEDVQPSNRRNSSKPDNKPPATRRMLVCA